MKLFIISFFITFACYAQSNDSLLFQLASIENDTERVNQLYQAGFNLRNTDPDVAYQFALACNNEATACKSLLHLAKSYNLLGILFYKKADYNKALQFQKKSLALNQSIQNQYGIAINQSNLGNIYSETNYPKLAEQSYLASLQASNKTNNTLQITRCLINIGVLKHDQKEYSAAIKQFEEALVYATQIGNQDLSSICYNNIGAILKDQNKIDSALLYLEEALKIKQLTDNEFELADSYINIADIYISQKNFNQASNYILLATENSKQYENQEALIELYMVQSRFYEAQQNFEQANIFLKKHYSLKDSMQKVEQESKAVVFSYDKPVDNSLKHTSKEFSNTWLLISLLMLIIFIPLFLIRFKR
jgi:tetratricopeptide (TPR) repeat protein